MRTRLAVMFMVSLCFFPIYASCRPVCDPRTLAAQEYMQTHYGDPDNELNVWLYKRYSDSARVDMERKEHTFEQLEKWARTLPKVDADAYLSVIQWYEDGEKAAYSEWHTHALQKRQAAYDEQLRRCDEEKRKYEAVHKLPTPPTHLQ